MVEITVIASSSRGNCYHVTDGATQLLLECGIPFPETRKRLAFGVSGLAGCLVSHEHGDHSKAVRDVMAAGVDVYASPGTVGALGFTGHRLRPVKALQQFRVGTWTVLPFDAIHDAAEPLGFLLASPAGKVLYLTDSAYCRYRFHGLTHVMLEANYSEEILRENVASGLLPLAHKNRVLRNHLSIERVLGLLRANNLSHLREVWLLHLSDGNSDADLFKREVQRLTGKPVYVAQA